MVRCFGVHKLLTAEGAENADPERLFLCGLCGLGGEMLWTENGAGVGHPERALLDTPISADIIGVGATHMTVRLLLVLLLGSLTLSAPRIAAVPQTSDASVTYPVKPGAGRGKHVVFLAGDEEYRSEEALPMLAKIMSQRHGFKATVLADEDPMQRIRVAGELEIGLEARELASVAVAANDQVHAREQRLVRNPVGRRAGKKDHPGAGSEHRPVVGAKRLQQPGQADELPDRGRFAAGQDDAVGLGELTRDANFYDLGAQAAQHRRVLANVALDGEDPDPRSPVHGSYSSPARRGR